MRPIRTPVTFYGTSDDSTPGRGLYQINLDGTATLIADYPDAQTDIDGLAVGDNGVAYLVIDQPGFIYPYDLVGGAYLPFFDNPWTTSEIFCGGAWITGSVAGPAISLTKTVGTTPAVCAPTDTITVGFGTEVTYCYTVENIGDTTFEFHDLEDDQLGTLLTDFPYTLAPGGTTEVFATATITAPVTNTATWTAADALPGYAFDDTVPFQFIDISATGTALGLLDDGEADITMPFDFTFYGMTSDQVCVGNNGAMIFGSTGCSVSFSNGALPSSSVPMGILPFWDDMDDETGDVYYETVGTAPNRQFIVEWFDRPHFNGVGTATFEVILFEGSNEILFQYQDVDFGDATFDLGASATVGLNLDAATANQYSYNSPVLDNGMAILWTSSTPVEATDQASATVNLEDPDIDVTPTSLASSLLVGTMETQQLTIANVGSATLDWNLEEALPSLARFPQMPNVAGLGDDTVAEERSGAAVPPMDPDATGSPAGWAQPQVVLYDNGPLITHPGGGAGGADASALQTVLGLGSYGFGHQVSAGNRIADDFTIADASGWTIETITFFAYQTGSPTTSTITAVNLQIWDGPPDGGGTVIWGDSTTNVMTDTTWSNIYRVLDTALTDTARPIMASTVAVNTFLPAGHLLAGLAGRRNAGVRSVGTGGEHPRADHHRERNPVHRRLGAGASTASTSKASHSSSRGRRRTATARPTFRGSARTRQWERYPRPGAATWTSHSMPPASRSEPTTPSCAFSATIPTSRSSRFRCRWRWSSRWSSCRSTSNNRTDDARSDRVSQGA